MAIRKTYYPDEIAHALCHLSDSHFEEDEWAPCKENYCQAALYDFMAICENPNNREEYKTLWDVLQNIAGRFACGDFGKDGKDGK